MSSENSKLDIESEYPLVSASGKRYKMIAPNIREYVSGTRYDETKGRGGIIQSPKSVMITPETAPAMQALGIESRLLAKQEAVRRGALLKLADKRKISLEELSKASEVDAEAIGYSLMERIQDKYSANGVAAAKLYMEQQDMLPKQQPKAGISDGVNTISGDPAFVERMARLAAEARGRRDNGDKRLDVESEQNTRTDSDKV